MLQGSIVSPRKMYQLILMNVCLFVNTRVHGLPAGQTFKMAKAQFGQRFPNYNHYSSKKYDLLQFFRHLNPRRKGRRRRRCSVLVLSTSHCSTALPLCTARQLVYFVVHSMYCWRPLVPSRFCNFSRKERKRKHVHLPTPLVSYIFLGLACLKQA